MAKWDRKIIVIKKNKQENTVPAKNMHLIWQVKTW